MAGRVEGKVAFITGAARGQGRSHAVRLAQEGADIVAVDICEDIPSVSRFYAGATEADLAETVEQVEALDRRIVATEADVWHTCKAAIPHLIEQGAGGSIRVNTVHPTSVDTGMIQNESTYRLFLPDAEHPSRADAEPVFRTINALPVPWVDPVDISNAVLFLASDEARYVTGLELKVDAGYTIK